jgi:uncharacterized membrane protein
MTKMIGILIGLLLVIGGIYYLATNKNDAESKRIYGIASIIGVIVIVVAYFIL